METVHGALTSLLPVNAVVVDLAGRRPHSPPSAVIKSGTSETVSVIVTHEIVHLDLYTSDSECQYDKISLILYDSGMRR